MIAEQVPIGREAVAAAVASPWAETPDDIAPQTENVERPPVAIVGPAALMTVLIRGATRNVADALGEALRGPQPRRRRAHRPAPADGAGPSSPA